MLLALRYDNEVKISPHAVLFAIHAWELVFLPDILTVPDDLIWYNRFGDIQQKTQCRAVLKAHFSELFFSVGSFAEALRPCCTYKVWIVSFCPVFRRITHADNLTAVISLQSVSNKIRR